MVRLEDGLPCELVEAFLVFLAVGHRQRGGKVRAASRL